MILLPEQMAPEAEQQPSTPSENQTPNTELPPEVDPPVVEPDPPVVEPDTPVVEPDPPVVEPDPPVVDPDPPVVPSDPTKVEYWLYHIANRPLTSDRDALNAIIRASGSVSDILSVKRNFTAAEISALISAYTLPKVGYLASGERQPTSFFDFAQSNRDLLAVADTTAKTALTVCKADIRAFPVANACYSDNLMQDLFQEASLPTGTPVLLLHQSADGQFYFVYSYFYSGWIAADQLALASEDAFALFANPDEFAVVTVPQSANGLCMGTILPLISQNENGVVVALPDGGTAMLSHFEVSIGFMEPTVHNLLQLSFSLVGLPYAWGDKGTGVDCSGMYVAAFRCMGIFLPRNTGDMRGVKDANYISLKESTLLDIPSALLIFRPGHVMLYLGTVEGKHYILHAPGSGNFVRVDVLSRTDNLISAFAPL